MSSQRTPPIAIDNARDMLLDSIIPFEELEVISLDRAMAEFAGETLISNFDLPATQNAAVDGYGVHSDSLFKDPIRLLKSSVLCGRGILLMASSTRMRQLKFTLAALCQWDQIVSPCTKTAKFPRWQ